MRRLLTTLVFLLVLLVAVDRIAVAVTSRLVASRMKAAADLDATPSVSITGFPFLTQAINGRYDRVVVRTGALSRGGVRLSSLDVTLTGAQVPLSAALSGSVQSVPVSGITATAAATYADVAKKGDLVGISVSALGSGVRVTGRVTVLGQSVTAATDSTVRLDGRTIVITAQKVSVLGQSSGLLNSALAGRFDFRVPVGRLPYGLQLTGVRATAAGLLLSARSGATVIPVRTTAGS